MLAFNEGCSSFTTNALLWKRGTIAETGWVSLWGWSSFRPRMGSAQASVSAGGAAPSGPSAAEPAGPSAVAPGAAAAAALPAQPPLALGEEAQWNILRAGFKSDSGTGWVKLASFCAAVGASSLHTGRYVDGTQPSRLWRYGAQQRAPRENIDWKPLPGNRGGGAKSRGPIYCRVAFLKQVWRERFKQPS